MHAAQCAQLVHGDGAVQWMVPRRPSLLPMVYGERTACITAFRARLATSSTENLNLVVYVVE